MAENNTEDVTKKLEEASLTLEEVSFAGQGLKLDKDEDGKIFLHYKFLATVHGIFLGRKIDKRTT